MKTLLTATIIALVFSWAEAKNTNYHSLWQQIDNLEKQSLPKSALEVANKIKTQAKSEKDTEQYIKALLHIIKYRNLTTREDRSIHIKTVEAELGSMPFPADNILHSIIGELYIDYYQRNRWKILDRTAIANDTTADISLWSAPKFAETALWHYTMSTQMPDKLQNINMANYQTLLLNYSGEDLTQPKTLLDFLTTRALEFLSNTDQSIAPPEEPYTLSNDTLFAPAEKFVALKLPQGDTTSFTYHYLKTIQNYEKALFANNKKDWLVLTELERLQFSRQQLQNPITDSLYADALKKLHERNTNSIFNKHVLFSLANHYFKKGQQATLDTTNFIIAENYCSLIVTEKNARTIEQKAQQLLSEINTQTISFITEPKIIPNQKQAILINYKNARTGIVQIRSITQSAIDSINANRRNHNRQEKALELYNVSTEKYKFSVALPNHIDKRDHTTEILLPALPVGQYIVFLSTTEQSKSLLCYNFVQATHLFTKHLTSQDTIEQLVLDRANGTPIKNAIVIFQSRSERCYGNRNCYKTVATKKTNSDGEAFHQPSSKNRQFRLVTIAKKDTIFDEASFFSHYRRDPEKEKRISAAIFTDRKIYRPGQTVFYKAILYNIDGTEKSTAADEQCSVYFVDSNHEEIGTLQQTTNKFGSIAGSFTIPVGGLNGIYQLIIQGANNDIRHQIRVESYKRPKTKIDLAPISKSFTFGDSVTITGALNSFSGAPMSNAKITVNVSERAHYPGFWYRQKKTKRASITTETNSNGVFSFTIRLPRPKQIGTGASFVQIDISATDESGETIEKSMEMPVEAVAFRPHISAKKQYNRSEQQAITVSFSNSVAESILASGTAYLVRLETPAKTLRNRLWPQPESVSYTSEEWAMQYPGNEYLNESSIEGRALVDTIKQFKFSACTKKTFRLEDDIPCAQYAFIVEAHDEWGRTSTAENRFRVWSHKSADNDESTMFEAFTDKDTVEVGSTATIHLFSSEALSYLLEVEQNGKRLSSQGYTTKNNHTKIDIPISESMQGGITAHIVSVAQSRDLSTKKNIYVPFTQKTLQIETETIRTPLLPGSNQSWSFTIKDNNNKPETCELLAGMYDASLDVFTPNKWTFTPFRQYYSSLRWSTPNKTDRSSRIHWPQNKIRVTEHEPLELNWFGYKYRSFARPMAASRGLKAWDDGEQSNFALEESAGNIDVTAAISDIDEETPIEIRTDFAETAFFYPQLKTDGSAKIQFNVPESLTEWNFQLLAHTQDLSTGKYSATITSAKPIMVQPNWPRFLYEQDTITLSARITNMTDSAFSVIPFATFSVIGAESGVIQPLHSPAKTPTNILPGTTVTVQWRITIPKGTTRFSATTGAKSATHSDAEKVTIPVKSRWQLLSETLPMYINGNESKKYTCKSLVENNEIERYTVEVTSNPIWYALQALPSIAETRNNCSIDLVGKYFSHTVADFISRKHPDLKKSVGLWSDGTVETQMNKNSKLKTASIGATPWLAEAKEEKAQADKLTELFNTNTNNYERNQTLAKLAKMQLESGAWPWFAGGRANTYTTQQILYILAKCRNQFDQPLPHELNISNAIKYIDQQTVRLYKEQLRGKSRYYLPSITAHYLLTRSFFTEEKMDAETAKAHSFFLDIAEKEWHKKDIRTKAMLAIVFFRNNNNEIAEAILNSIKEHSINSEELGIFWKQDNNYFRNYSEIETHTIAMSAFKEISNDTATINGLLLWLIGNKRTNKWETSIATTEAIAALFSLNDQWTESDIPVSISVGDQTIKTNEPAPIGGVISKTWHSPKIANNMELITLKNPNSNPAWGAAFIQFYGLIDSINNYGTSLSITKELYQKVDKQRSTEMALLSHQDSIATGENIIVRICIETDRDLEFVHLKDNRAAGLEPQTQTSGYRWQGQLGYYQATGDISTDFFIDYLPAGKHWFQYTLIASQPGSFANGTATIQSFYAPEFSSHSNGRRITITQ